MRTGCQAHLLFPTPEPLAALVPISEGHAKATAVNKRLSIQVTQAVPVPPEGVSDWEPVQTHGSKYAAQKQQAVGTKEPILYTALPLSPARVDDDLSRLRQGLFFLFPPPPCHSKANFLEKG
ncbi:hypothetical protein DPEC_G00004770 [Dallia pectoralis]|uniref:Uncharacterized protein n=1 Tax=Dallia pectoralis TaxID=75939 RepID=A0ACC2HKL1_DALPE|nr:hypothetical protein DPEC_G00004770 [Dallia pectoralis]